jgi:hypothetical protein
MATFDLIAGSNLDFQQGSNWTIGGVVQSAPPGVNDTASITGTAAAAIRCLIAAAAVVEVQNIIGTAGGTTTTPLSVGVGAQITVGSDSSLINAMALAGSSSSQTTPVLINSGTIRCRGNVTQSNAPVQMNGGSKIQFISATHATAMTWQVGTASSTTNAAMVTNGTTASSRATFEAVGGAVGSFTTTGFGTGRWRIQYGTFSGLGTSSVAAVVFNADNVSSASCFFDDCLVKNCGKFDSTQNVHVGATCAVRRTVMRGCLNADALNFFGGSVSGVTGVHELLDNYFDARVRINCGMKIERNIFNTPTQQGSITLLANNGALTWADNMFCVLLGTTGQSLNFGTNLSGGIIGRTLATFAGNSSNPHPFSMGNTMSTNVTLEMRHWFLDFGSASFTSTVPGDFIDIFASATVGVTTTLKYRNIISNSNAAGWGAGHLFRMGSNASNNGALDIQIQHCSHYSDGSTGTFSSECPMVNYGEPTATLPNGQLSLFKSNFVYCPSGRPGSLMCRYGASNGTVEYCAPANATNNAAWQAGTGAGNDGYGYARDPAANQSFPSGAPGTVLNADPQLVDIFRSVAKFDLAKGGVGTQANCLAELGKRHDPELTWNPDYNFDDLHNYLEGGWASANAAYAAAHDAASPVTEAGIWIGAVAGITPPDTSFRIPMVARRFIAGTGDTMSYVAIPLRPGKLFPDDVTAGKGRPMLNGVEIQCVLTPITEPGNLNADGSLKSIYGQFLMPSLTQNVDVIGEFRCDDTRTLSALTEAPVIGTGAPLDSPSNLGPGGESYNVYYLTPGAYVPSSPTDLCNSGMFGLFIRPVSEDPSSGAAATYFSRYATAMTSEFIDRPGGTGWVGTTLDRAWYYDPLLEYLRFWARTGDLRFLQHGYARYARARALYYNVTSGGGPNRFLTDEPHHPTKGFGLAWWMFKDPDGKISSQHFGSNTLSPLFNEYNYVGRADNSLGWQRSVSNRLRDVVWQYLHGFTQDRFGNTITDAMRLNVLLKYLCDPSGPPLKPIPSWGPLTMSPTLGGASVSYISRQQLQMDGVAIMVHIPFQGALETDALMEWYDRMPLASGGKDTRIITAVKTIADFWWNYCRYPEPGSGPGSGTFLSFTSAQYNGPPGNAGGPNPAEDLNGFHIGAYYWLAWKLADQGYLDKGDELLDAHTRTPYNGSTGPFIHDTTDTNAAKQMIEWGYNSADTLGIRALAVEAIANAGGSTHSTIDIAPLGAMSFTARIGQSDPPEQTKTISNSAGSGDLSTLSATTAYVSGAGWLTQSLGATAAPTILHVQPSLGALTAGTYDATITVDSTATDLTNPGQVIAVQFIVLPAITLGSWIPYFSRSRRR